jgi:hypothetical protein
MMHETKELEITIGSHTSKVVFNVISSPINPTIIGYFCSFYTIREWIGIQRVFILKHQKKKHQNVKLCLFGENQDYHLGALEDDLRSDQCM